MIHIRSPLAGAMCLAAALLPACSSSEKAVTACKLESQTLRTASQAATAMGDGSTIESMLDGGGTSLKFFEPNGRRRAETLDAVTADECPDVKL